MKLMHLLLPFIKVIVLRAIEPQDRVFSALLFGKDTEYTVTAENLLREQSVY